MPPLRRSPPRCISEAGPVFDLVRRVVRAVPDRLPGKTRLARLALRPFLERGIGGVRDGFGDFLHLPSLREPIALGLFAFGVYEPDTLAAILDLLPPGGVLVDVGANIGALALPVARCRPGARIVCIEADPEIASLLQRNVADNGVSNISVVQCLAGPATDPGVPFYRAPADKFGMGSVGPQFGAASVMLQQRMLDRVLDELGIDQVDVVKLDVEGAELGALQGARRRLTSRRPPAVILEFADWAETRIAGQAAGSAQQFLLSLGYALFRLARGGAPAVRLAGPVVSGSAMILALPSPREG